MTRKQFRRMKIFAMRMAKTLPNYRYRKRCLNYVREMLGRMQDESYGIYYRYVIDWDNSETYSAEEIAADPALRWVYYKASLLCDYMKSHNGLAEYDSNLSRERPDSDGSYDTVLLNHVKCCIRAACDVAVSPSAGVLGWTIGDLRAMWKNQRLPRWVTSFFEVDIITASDETPVWL